jgi:Domain of unknown function (DUF4265)
LSERGIAEGFAFLNSLVAHADVDMIELLRSGVFEVLCDTAVGIERARAHLVPAARRIFEEVAADYETSATGQEAEVEIWVPVQQDAAGFPNQEWEQLHAWPVQGGYRLNSIPFFAKDLAVNDVVAASEREGGLLVFESVVIRSGHSTFRIWLTPEKQEDARTIIDEVRRLGGHAELTLDRLVAVDAPPEKEKGIWDILKAGQVQGYWDLQVRYSPEV